MKLGRIIAVANQKGGVGKSTTAINLSACLAEKGKKVLAIDMDPQGNTTSGFGVDKNGIENTLYELLLGEAETKDTIVKDVVENLDLIPSNINLSGAEIELVGIDDKEFILKGITDKLRRKYDYIILDCPPSLNMLTINALTAATSVLVPIQCEYYALEGLSQLIHTIDLVKERLNKRLKMEGVVFTMYDARTNSGPCDGFDKIFKTQLRCVDHQTCQGDQNYQTQYGNGNSHGESKPWNHRFISFFHNQLPPLLSHIFCLCLCSCFILSSFISHKSDRKFRHL